MVQSPFPIDNPPLCTIQVQQIVTSSGLNRWRSAGPMREVRRMARMSFWLASSRWRGWRRPAEHPQQPRVCHIGHGFHPEQEERISTNRPVCPPPFLSTYLRVSLTLARGLSCLRAATVTCFPAPYLQNGHGCFSNLVLVDSHRSRLTLGSEADLRSPVAVVFCTRLPRTQGN